MTAPKSTLRPRRRTTAENLPRKLAEWFAGERTASGIPCAALVYPDYVLLPERWEIWKDAHPDARPRTVNGRISTSMTSSPMRRFASSSCWATGSFSRSLRPASIPASARSRHCSSLKIGTETSRERASTGSPRNKRSTTSFFRPADQRFTSATAPRSLPVALRAPSSEPAAILPTSFLFS